MEHNMLPKHLHFKTPSPHIPWERLPVKVVAEAVPWANNHKPRTAGISSFGFSGTNSHVLMQEAPRSESSTGGAVARRYHLLPLSARTPHALLDLVDRYQAWLDTHTDAGIADVCHTAAVGRTHFEHRAALIVYSNDRARELLTALREERP